jgi:DNA-cytosine methyltransferase
MKVLSLFDGMSVAQQALKELGYTPDYYASEIDEYAIAVTQSNHPKTILLGDVKDVILDGLRGTDLLIGGSPCQDLSIAKKGRKGLDGERSGLFYEYVRIRDEVKPKYFILENVASMTKENKDKISEVLGVQPVMINASLVSAQNRKRLFWIGAYSQLDDKYYTVAILQPKDKELFYSDIMQDYDNDYSLSKKTEEIVWRNFAKAKKTFLHLKESVTRIEKMSYPSRINQVFGEFKIPTLTSSMGAGGNNVPVVTQYGKFRKLTPTECLRLQSMPDNYFDQATYKGKPISNTQRYKMCGNAFNCAVIKHILTQIKL